MPLLLTGEDQVQFDSVHANIRLKNKSDTLQFIARAMAPGLYHTEQELLEMLNQGSQDAAIGDGFALPVVILPRLSRPYATLVTLERPVNFAASDARPVDLVFALALPAKDGPLNRVRLSRISRLFRDPVLCSELREARSENDLMAVFMVSENRAMAA